MHIKLAVYSSDEWLAFSRFAAEMAENVKKLDAERGGGIGGIDRMFYGNGAQLGYAAERVETGQVGSSAGATASEAPAPEEKPKKTRAKKADTAPAEAAKEPETAAEATTYVATEQDARDALRRLHEATNEDTCMEALNSFNNARRISEVPDDQRTAFVLLCNEKIAAAAGKVS